MLIAREKKKNNIAEYILYMWQLEDMLRALKLDMEQVDRYLVAGFQADERTSKEIHDWYDNLIAIMQKEKVEEKGHIQALKNTVDELTELHFFLLHQAHDGRYRQLVTQAAGNLVEFRRKAGVECCACWLREFNRKPKPVRKNMKKLILKPGSKSWCCPTNMEKWKLFRWMEMRSK